MALWKADLGGGAPKNVLGFVNLPPAPFVYPMSARETPGSRSKSWPRAGEVEIMMAAGHANFCSEWTPAAARAGQPASALPVYPLRL